MTTFRKELTALITADLGADIYDGIGAATEIFEIVTKSHGVLAGMKFVPTILDIFQRDIFLTPPSGYPDPLTAYYWAEDGKRIVPGEPIARFCGNSEILLKAERMILNVLTRASGIATHVNHVFDRVRHTGVKLLDTRKSPATLRMLDKYAFMVGGGVPHRAGFYDGVMVKDNDLAVAGSVTGAIDRAFRTRRFETMVEIEVGSLTMLDDVLRDGRAHIIMLDNMSIEHLRLAVSRIRAEKKPYVIEASGVGDQDLLHVANTGVDAISLSSLVAKGAGYPLDMSMKVVTPFR